MEGQGDLCLTYTYVLPPMALTLIFLIFLNYIRVLSSQLIQTSCDQEKNLIIFIKNVNDDGHNFIKEEPTSFPSGILQINPDATFPAFKREVELGKFPSFHSSSSNLGM